MEKPDSTVTGPTFRVNRVLLSYASRDLVVHSKPYLIPKELLLLVRKYVSVIANWLLLKGLETEWRM